MRLDEIIPFTGEDVRPAVAALSAVLNDQKEGAAAPSFGIHPHGAAAGPEVRRFDKHPGI